MKTILAKIPDRFLLNLPNLEKGKNCTKHDYFQELKYYTDRILDHDFYQPSDEIPRVIEVSRKKTDNVDEVLYSFNSNYNTYQPKVQADYDKLNSNLYCYLNTWIQDKKAPLVLCIHGLKMGKISTSYKMFKIKKMLDKGLNVALMIQPHHGIRSVSSFKQYFLNPGDLPLSIESARQANSDANKSLNILLNMGFPKVGVLGASLGGFTALNLASVSDKATFIFAAQPAIHFENFLKVSNANMAFGLRSKEQWRFNQAQKIISPLNNKRKMKAQNIGILYHQDDLITPASAVEELNYKWKIPIQN
jgi:hypothetical protein